tara:strand:+ start:1968 stop:2468 length:501 start_codon:yes stop_codon:yes gene_type:complete
VNLFYLHVDPAAAAQYQCDKHVVKMILETAQMLSTAHRELDGDENVPDVLYKRTHKNHPSTVWVRSEGAHYDWAYRHFAALCDEYTYRYGKVHLTDTKLRDVLATPPAGLPYGRWAGDPPQCMPDEYKQADTVEAYRAYYQSPDKRRFAAWSKARPAPEWWRNDDD